MMTTSPIEDPQAVAVSPFPSRTVCYRPARTNMDPVLTLRPYPPANRTTSKRSRAIAGLRIKDWLAAAVPLIKNKLAAGLGAHPVNCGTSDVQRFRAGNRPVFVAKSSTASGPARLFTRFSGRERLPVRIRTVSCNPGDGTRSSPVSPECLVLDSGNGPLLLPAPGTSGTRFRLQESAYDEFPVGSLKS